MILRLDHSDEGRRARSFLWFMRRSALFLIQLFAPRRRWRRKAMWSLSVGLSWVFYLCAAGYLLSADCWKIYILFCKLDRFLA
jgi:hypothetical protein